ncbi:thioredoxin-related transmembrane protein 2 homolog [Macrosteles quadrilineatus]|uniref:thioredoxin-related transmembrane protein 2 homolog n=1 Tax=Macrosteles quadrilineatus TaxID=74068 RepID=UPI0023E093F8|nr:thioredoxin-related transmembrane protein 2 homolog [Macrosteles quadrilineatus]XP_054284800.1 thioredoxin-related transmembrane protein 2 homolog [Macrosteles quadrilineatus]
MKINKDVRLLMKPYYYINILLSASYIAAKKLPFLCQYTFPRSESQCEFDSRESEILFFLMIVVMIRTRKAGSVTMINYLSSSFMYTKVANLILWFYADIRMGIFFGILLILVGLLLPEPAYKGPENVVYFRTAQGVEDEIMRNKKICWLVTFYTAWNPACVNFAPVFSQLSVEYHLENLNFGKIDIGRYPDAGKKYYVNDSPMSRQLPTVILFKEGKEVMRRPMIDAKGKLQKFFFSEDNVKAAFDLNNLYNECKNNPLKKKKELTDHQKSE